MILVPVCDDTSACVMILVPVCQLLTSNKYISLVGGGGGAQLLTSNKYISLVGGSVPDKKQIYITSGRLSS